VHLPVWIPPQRIHVHHAVTDAVVHALSILNSDRHDVADADSLRDLDADADAQLDAFVYALSVAL